MIRRMLMKRNRELFDFEVDPVTGAARVIDASGTGADSLVPEELMRPGDNPALTKFVRIRAITPRRIDWRNIVASFGAQSPVHLAFMGHGLSLSDQYWYRAPGSTERWEDINFFDNEWGTDFGAAVLAGDYARLASCSPDVPDVTTTGRVVKAWERNDEGVFLVKSFTWPEGADLAGAKLASDLCAIFFGEGCYVPLEIVERNGKPCSASPLMLASDEELVDGSQLYAMTAVQEKSVVETGNMLTEERCAALIDAFAKVGISDATAYVAKMACLSCLTMLPNFHTDNFGAIRKVSSDTWRAAPIFDYNGAFGFIDNVRERLSLLDNPFIMKLFCVRTFSSLDSSWDWSWYDPRALEGFEDRILEAISPYWSLPPNFAETIAEMFVMQRNYVNGIAI